MSPDYTHVKIKTWILTWQITCSNILELVTDYLDFWRLTGRLTNKLCSLLHSFIIYYLTSEAKTWNHSFEKGSTPLKSIYIGVISNILSFHHLLTVQGTFLVPRKPPYPLLEIIRQQNLKIIVGKVYTANKYILHYYYISNAYNRLRLQNSNPSIFIVMMPIILLLTQPAFLL